jgi:hypothetical protein
MAYLRGLEPRLTVRTPTALTEVKSMVRPSVGLSEPYTKFAKAVLMAAIRPAAVSAPATGVRRS